MTTHAELQKRETRHHTKGSTSRIPTEQRAAMVAEIEKVTRMFHGYLNLNVFANSVSCLDRALAADVGGELAKKKGFPCACFLLANKFHEIRSPSISSLAMLCGVTSEEMHETEMRAFMCIGMDLYVVTAYDYMELLHDNFPAQCIRSIILRMLAGLYYIPSTDFLPSVAAVAILDTALPDAVKQQAGTQLSQFFESMVPLAQDVLECSRRVGEATLATRQALGPI